MKKRNKLKGKWLIYGIFWAISFYVSLEVFSQTDQIRVIDVIYTTLFHIPLLYAVSLHSFHLIPNYLAKSRFWLYGFMLVILLATVYPMYEFTFSMLAGWLFSGFYLVGVHNPFEVVGFALLYLVVSSSIEFAGSWLEALRTRSKIVELESQNTASELKALRAQVNPHFLFNSLNTIYSEALKKSDKAPQLILKLSDMLRYVVDKIEHEKVSLEEELEYLSNFIALHKERLNNPEQVYFSTWGDFSEGEIAPLLLLIFVENCFKHADLTEKEAKIHIELKMEDQQLSLYCKNTIFKEREKTKETSGAGIQNAKRRLELAYKNRYSLKIDERSNFYETELKMELD